MHNPSGLPLFVIIDHKYTTISSHRIEPDHDESDMDSYRSDTVSVTCMFEQNLQTTLFFLL